MIRQQTISFEIVIFIIQQNQSMKNNGFRLMKIFQIQNSYQKHKDRLLSIQRFDTKKKVSCSTTKNIQVVNTYKKQRLTSDIFTEKQKGTKINRENTLIHQNLTKVYTRDPNKTMNIPHSNSRTSLRSVSSAASRSSRIKQENQKLKDKIGTTKSTYHKFRQTNMNQNRKNSNTSKDEIVKLLQNQLGMKPKVVFPQMKRKEKKVSQLSQNIRTRSFHKHMPNEWKT